MLKPKCPVLVQTLVTICCALSSCADGVGDSAFGASLNGLDDAGQTERGRGVGSFQAGRANVYGSDTASQDAPWVYSVKYDILTLTPDGQTLLIGLPVPGPNKGWGSPQLALAAHNLNSGTTKLLHVSNVERVNFAPDAKVGWLITPSAQAGTDLWRMQVDTLKVTKHVHLADRYTTLDVTLDGQQVVLSNIPRDAGAAWPWIGCAGKLLRGGQQLEVDHCRYSLVDTQTGHSQAFDVPHPIRDLDFSPLGGELIFTWSRVEKGQAVATMRFHQPAAIGLAGIVSETEMPNCADEVVLSAKHGLALLAPSSCAVDPISVVDLATHSFVKNLPGFGPVSVVGDHALGFTTKAAMANEWQYAQKQPVGLIRVDLATLAWSVFELGNALPAYTPTPDGEHLLVWGGAAQQSLYDKPWLLAGNLKRVRIADGQIVDLDNASVPPGPFVWLPDGKMLTTSAGRLFRIDALAATVSWMPLGESRADLLRLTSDAGQVLLGEANMPRIHQLGLDSGQVVSRDLNLGAELKTGFGLSPAEQAGWSAVAIVDAGAIGASECGTQTVGARIASVTIERNGNVLPQEGTEFAQDVTCTFGDPVAGKGSPHHLQGRTLVSWPYWAPSDYFSAYTTRILPGDRIRIQRAADLPGAGLCLDGLPCADRPLSVTLLPPRMLLTKPPVKKALGVFKGKAELVIDVPEL